MQRKSSHIKAVRGMALVFLLCAALIQLVTQGRKENGILTFNGSFQVGGDREENNYLRKYTWEDAAGKTRETVFQIPEAALNDEIKKFGRPRAITHPLFAERQGFKIIDRRNYLRGHDILESITTIVDYRKIFQRNLNYFHGLTGALMTSAALSEGDDLVHHFLHFVQHISYRRPPDYYKGKFISSFFVPLVCLYEQYGDCDSKSLLLAEFLATSPNTALKTVMILIRGSGLAHALLGVKGTPLPGMTALYFQGKGYFIVLETTRTGWAPGFIDPRVWDALKSGYFQFIELD